MAFFVLACGGDTKEADPSSGSGVVDADGDGATAEVDCDDADPAVHPGADELCNEIDDNCDGVVDEAGGDGTAFYRDLDGDGYGDGTVSQQACTAPDGFVSESGDCDDARSDVYPGAIEEDCTDPVDYNCDGSTGYADLDGDGTPACDDCDDTDPEVNPYAAEICNDGVDDNCDGSADEPGSVGEQMWFADTDGDLHGDPAAHVVACTQPEGFVSNSDDCDDSASEANPSGVEVCDGLDNDCDGEIDGPDPIGGMTVYVDADGDGVGSAAVSMAACTPVDGFVASSDDCDDTDASAYPGAEEVCDGVDNDCSGEADEGLLVTVYADPDGDGFGLESVSAEACAVEDGWASASGDCDETDAAVHPDAAEVCDGVDNDCSGEADEGLLSTVYADLDGDGFGVESVSTEACEAGDGWAAVPGDCDEMDAAVHPDAAEVCDGVDNDCSGGIDEGLLMTVYPDLDGDGYGLTMLAMESCGPEGGTSVTGGDCDDTDASAYPDADEVCDGVDNDCSGEADEGLGITYYLDTDGDGFGVVDETIEACEFTVGYALTPGDCDNDDSTVNPAATEVCDDVDNDCDGDIDDDDSALVIDDDSLWFADADDDGFGDAEATVLACIPPEGYLADDSDCDDEDGAVFPGAEEVWYDDVDQDCSGGSDFDADGDGHDSIDSGGDDMDDADPDCWESCLGGLSSDDPVDSCQALAEDVPSAPNDWYWVDMDGVPTYVFCDIENGGWTQCFELVNTGDIDLGTENVWMNDCVDFTMGGWSGSEVRVTLVDGSGSTAYDEYGVRPSGWTYNQLTSTVEPSSQYYSGHHTDRWVTLTNGDKLLVTGQDSYNAGCGGSFGNGYGVLVYPPSPDYHSNVKMIVVPHEHIRTYSGSREFSGWTPGHEISYEASGMNTCSSTTSFSGSFAFWVR